MSNFLGRFWSGLTTRGKVAVVATAGIGTLLATRTAGAQIVGVHALATGDVVVLPGAFHLRSRPVASNAGMPELPAQSVRITGPVVAGVTRGASDALYPVTVVATGASGWAFIPTGAVRTTGDPTDHFALIGQGDTSRPGAANWFRNFAAPQSAALVVPDEFCARVRACNKRG